ncbi:YggS family pyridoxal phosphate-dependent enzyme [Herbaspirillum sp. LeCh32-8]|uniref:YggS family pyridoxal phosphate-dependent enzyme n=1 Tax=Herbaspirillum sp. LeCh32-8 TaxID=2821356 RepID=UPI001AE2C9DA|nr:YggS family pyridoxal phosphate-dependent enzyme [Herbaspirillum sp. LeCh32-8]MBP0600852.1 YggS family pyridoxal phosphate-dependent enzyme [Herbaspirillum sp. LeCh32-8]
MSSIAKNLQQVQHQIAVSAERAQRAPSSVQLLAVSKTFGPEAVAQAVAAGQLAFGENYLQEALDKIAAMQALAPGARLQWHFIGPIQSNKTRPIAEHFDWVHSVDRVKIARRLAEQRPAELGPLNICLQVNISGEDSKSGLAPQDLTQAAAEVAQLPKLRLRGLMAIPEPTDDAVRQRAAFAAVHALYASLRAVGLPLDTLSMGMSSDLEAAVAEGATIVRIGSAIFGARNYA